MTDRAITETELALIQMVVDARDDPKRVPDALIRQYAQRIAIEAVTEAEMGRLQALYNAMQRARDECNQAIEALPSYARRPTLAKLEAAWRDNAETPPAEGAER